MTRLRTLSAILPTCSTLCRRMVSTLGTRSLVESVFENSKQTPSVLFLVGAPGAGKGTISAYLRDQHNMECFSAGDLLRDHAARDPEVASVLAKGGIVPSEVSIRAILHQLNDVVCSGTWSMEQRGAVIVDGFPRSLDNALAWSKLGCKDVGALALDVARTDVLRKRLRERGRADDSMEVVDARLSRHWQEWDHIRTHFETSTGWHAVDGDGHAGEVGARVASWMGTQGLLPRQTTQMVDAHVLGPKV